MAQVQKNAPQKQDETEEAVQHDVSEITDDVDDLLADIDDVLEENAQDFVASYVQKGGQ